MQYVGAKVKDHWNSEYNKIVLIVWTTRVLPFYELLLFKKWFFFKCLGNSYGIRVKYSKIYKMEVNLRSKKKKQPMHHPLIEPLIQYKNSIITFCLIFYKYIFVK